MRFTVPLLATTRTQMDKRMDEMSYQQQALAGATGVELIVALYDGLIRFLYRAMQCVEENDVHGRRVAVKKALEEASGDMALAGEVGGQRLEPSVPHCGWLVHLGTVLQPRQSRQ